MEKTEHHLGAGASRRSLAVGLAALCAPTTAIALAHMLETAQRGVICGISHAGGGHCWACYAAPILALAAIVSWRRDKTTPRFINARI
jgi:hypothetical protein